MSVFVALVLYSCILPEFYTSAARLAHDHIELFKSPATYSVDTAVLINDLTRKDKEIGYKIQGSLAVEAIWTKLNNEFLLKFKLVSPKLMLRGKHPNASFLTHKSIWDKHQQSTFYALWKEGAIEAAFLDPKDEPDILNYKKSIISLFQFQVIDGVYNETDVSGVCEANYETMSPYVFRKIKRHCVWEGDFPEEESGNADHVQDTTSASRITRYELAESLHMLKSVHAEELHSVGRLGSGLKARAWHILHLLPSNSNPAVRDGNSGIDLESALAELPKEMVPTSLELSAQNDESDLYRFSVNNVLAAHRELLEVEDDAGVGGSPEHAAAALELLLAVWDATEEELLTILKNPDNHKLLPALCDAIGASGTMRGFGTVHTFLNLEHEPSVPLGRRYLAGLSLSQDPQEQAVVSALRLSAVTQSPALAESALLAAASAAGRLRPSRSRKAVGTKAKNALLKSLSECEDEACKAVRLLPLGNLYYADTVDLLMEHAERGGSKVALAAVDALAQVPRSLLQNWQYCRRLERVAINASQPLEVRAGALDLVLQLSVEMPARLADLAAHLHEYGPHELRRIFWQGLRALAVDHEAVGQVLPMFDSRLRTWDAMAMPGTSSVLVREAWSVGGWAARLSSVQGADGGVLRRGVVRLHARDPRNYTSSVLAVELWTRGLHGLMGVSGDDSEEASGGLAFTIGDTRMRGLTLFTDQMQLASHIWAGTGSTPTPVLRTIVPLPRVELRAPLGVGVPLRVLWRSAAVHALDAEVQVSMWSRIAHAGIDLRSGVASAAGLHVRTAWGELRAAGLSKLGGRLTVDADVDFYDGVKMCVRPDVNGLSHSYNVTLRSVQGADQFHVQRTRSEHVQYPPRTLSLGWPNDLTCVDLNR